VIGYGPDDYNPQQANETTVIKPPAVVGDGGGWLVVEDFRQYRPHRQGAP
jgi:hypothetical protein